MRREEEEDEKQRERAGRRETKGAIKTFFNTFRSSIPTTKIKFPRGTAGEKNRGKPSPTGPHGPAARELGRLPVVTTNQSPMRSHISTFVVCPSSFSLSTLSANSTRSTSEKTRCKCTPDSPIVRTGQSKHSIVGRLSVGQDRVGQGLEDSAKGAWMPR